MNKIGSFSPEELTMLINCSTVHEHRKGDVLLPEGRICQSIFFLVNGSAARHHYLHDGEQVVMSLYTRGAWMLDNESFASQIPSRSKIEVLQNAMTYEWSMHDLHALIAKSQSFLRLGKVIYQDEGVKRRALQHKRPDDRYKFLLDEYPEILQSFPQKMIASFLGMSPETLSRVRGRIKKQM